MLSRLLLIHLEGFPHSWHVTAGEVRQRILRFEPEDADAIQVFAVTHDRDPAHEVTAQFTGEIGMLRQRAIPLPDFLKLARAI